MASVLGARRSLQPDVYLALTRSLTRSLQKHRSTTALLSSRLHNASHPFNRLTSHHITQVSRHSIGRTFLSLDQRRAIALVP
jgi:hypothetical protein